MIDTMQNKHLSIYIHIPFCVRKCFYCDFLSAPASELLKEQYVERICQEIEVEAPHYKEYQVDTVFVGGGTPTTLRPVQISRILDTMFSRFQFSQGVECTIECNPGTVDVSSLKTLRKSGINRLSIGLQSAQNNELRILGRIHTWEQFIETYNSARFAGFENINIDLMSALPGQTAISYQESLQKVLCLSPEHISAYSLIIEEGTPFYDQYHALDLKRKKTGEKMGLLPSEEEERLMYHLTKNILQKAGYHQYEISNYAKEGFECKHNKVYWNRGNYLGIGLGSSSCVENIRWKREENLHNYLNLPFHKKEISILSQKEQMEEYMFLGLRMIDGISIQTFEEMFGCRYKEVYGKVTEKMIQSGLLKATEDSVKLTNRGLDVCNRVFAEFLLDE